MTKVEMQMVITETLRQVGLLSGEISERQARKTYGKPLPRPWPLGRFAPSA